VGSAFVPQEQNIFATLSVRENLRWAAGSISARDAPSHRCRVLRFPPCWPSAGRVRRRTLSGGRDRYWRCHDADGRAGAVAANEPSAGLSPIAAETLFATIREINRDGHGHRYGGAECHAGLAIAHRATILVDGRNTAMVRPPRSPRTRRYAASFSVRRRPNNRDGSFR